MQLILIRHLPTEWNQKHWLQGRRDIRIEPPAPEQMDQVIANRSALDFLTPFTHVLSSRLKRTQETAFVYGYHPEPEPLLDELDFGPFEAQPRERLYEHYGKEWTHSPRQLILGEKVTDLEERIILFLNKYREASSVLAFGHGAWIRALLSLHRFGHINKMNQLAVANNECFHLEIKDAARKEIKIGRDIVL